MYSALDEISKVIEFAEEYKGIGWHVSSAMESFRYKDTGEILWTIKMVNRGSSGEREDRILITAKNGVFQARPVELNRWLPTSHYSRIKPKVVQEGA